MSGTAASGRTPKRSEERRRTNSVPADRVIPPQGIVPAPPLPEGLHQLAIDWYASLSLSAQSQYYEPSDWQTALGVAVAWSAFHEGGSSSAALLTAIRQMQEPLLVTEGTRRRAHMEVVRGVVPEGEKPANVSELRARLSKGGRRGR